MRVLLQDTSGGANTHVPHIEEWVEPLKAAPALFLGVHKMHQMFWTFPEVQKVTHCLRSTWKVLEGLRAVWT